LRQSKNGKYVMVPALLVTAGAVLRERFLPAAPGD